MSKKFIFCLFTTFISLCTFAQQKDPVAITINEKPILRSELVSAYKKSNELRSNEDKEPFNDFLNAYIKMKLNIEEALNQKIDTVASFQRDLSSARVQLSYKYMQNTEYEDDFIQKIYNRLLNNLEINQAYLPFNKEAVLPSDTLALYKEALALRQELEDNGFQGEGYNQLNNPSTNIQPNGQFKNGYIGWINPFMYPSILEDAIYNLPLNEISQPIRSHLGYHIIQVLNKRPAIGAVELEQVVFSFNRIPPTHQQIDSVGKVAWREYNNIKSDDDFNSLCADFSRVMETGDRGCYLGIINFESMMPPSFINAAFKMEKEGDISQPILTDYGFHIVRLLKKYPVPEFSKSKASLRKKILESDKSTNIKDNKREYMSKGIQFNVNDAAYEKLRGLANTLSPKDSLFIAKLENRDEVLFSIDGKLKYTVGNFIDYIRFRNQISKKTGDEGPDMYQFVDAAKYTLSTDILKDYFDSYSSIKLSDFYYNTLENRFLEFGQQIQEVSDGLLLFNVKNKNIWERSKTDKNGLVETFDKNQSKYKLDNPMYKGIILFAKDEISLTKAKAIASNHTKIEGIIEDIRNNINTKGVVIQMEPGLWQKGNNQFVDNQIFGGEAPTLRKEYPFFYIVGQFIDSPQDYTDVLSVVEVDYQNELEKEWDTYLNNKYEVKLVKSVLDKIK